MKSSLQNHEGPTESRKGHSAHGRKAKNKIKPTSETEGINHYSQSANKQSINLSINQSIDRSINRRRIDPSVNQSIDESIDPNSSQDDKKKHISKQPPVRARLPARARARAARVRPPVRARSARPPARARAQRASARASRRGGRRM